MIALPQRRLDAPVDSLDDVVDNRKDHIVHDVDTDHLQVGEDRQDQHIGVAEDHIGNLMHHH
ncbi:hypothetical protein D3C75_716990 [compost metagenome]